MNIITVLREWLQQFIVSQQKTPAATAYRIVAVDDSYHDTGKVYVKVQVVGLSKTFQQPVSELYKKEWLDNFSKEDVAHIAALYTAEQTNNLEIIKKFPKKTPATRASIVIVGILFAGFLILSNLSAFKVVQFGALVFPAGLIFFPLTYVFDDILTEVYGFKVSRRVIWTALFANLIVIIGTSLTIHLPASPYWHGQQAYATIYQATPRIFLASTLAYVAGEFTNSITLAKLKILTAGRHLWLRAISSTAIGVGVDTILFAHIAFWAILPNKEIWQMIATMYCVKVLYEICAVPITYLVTNYLKKKDSVDHYDFQTKFNPFSLEVD